MPLSLLAIGRTLKDAQNLNRSLPLDYLVGDLDHLSPIMPRMEWNGVAISI
jgi:hypothetical protein